MLKLKAMARVAHFQGRKEFKGAERVRAVTIKLAFEGIPATTAKAFVSQIELMFNDAGDPSMPELLPSSLANDIYNVEVSVGELRMKGADITDVVITPLQKCMCAVDMKINCQATDVLDVLHRYLDEKVEVELIERQVVLESAPDPT